MAEKPEWMEDESEAEPQPRDEPEPTVETGDEETVLVTDRHGRESRILKYGPIQQTETKRYGIKRWRAKIVVDECKHDGTTEATRVKRHGYGTSYCPLCDASCGVDGLWRVLENL